MFFTIAPKGTKYLEDFARKIVCKHFQKIVQSGQTVTAELYWFNHFRCGKNGEELLKRFQTLFTTTGAWATTLTSQETSQNLERSDVRNQSYKTIFVVGRVALQTMENNNIFLD